jgi:mono/diheme cytochrome c family protein
MKFLRSPQRSRGRGGKKLRSHWFLAAGAVALSVLVGLAMIDSANVSRAKHRLKPDDAEVVARGERVYQSHCASCHGANLQGQPNWRERGPDGLLPAPPHDASGHTWHHSDDLLFKMTKYGVANAAKVKDYKTAMPVYEGVLRDEEIVAVLSWIKAQWPPDVRERQDQLNRKVRR